MATKAGFQEVDAKSHEALTRFFTRTDGWQQVDLNLPFDDLLRMEVAEEEGLEPPGEYEFQQRRIGAMILFQALISKGATAMEVYRQTTAFGRAMHVMPFHAMTMHEVAMMEGQSPAAHSWRCNLVSGKIELAGMKGSKLPGQKSKAARESYKKCRKGNKNRLGGNKLNRHPASPRATPGRDGKPKARQGSFLKALHVKKKVKAEQFQPPTHEQI